LQPDERTASRHSWKIASARNRCTLSWDGLESVTREELLTTGNSESVSLSGTPPGSTDYPP
jgi:hypothetical protein